MTGLLVSDMPDYINVVEQSEIKQLSSNNIKNQGGPNTENIAKIESSSQDC